MDKTKILIGLDVGRVRVGIAISDPSGRMALPLETVERAKGKAEQRVLELAMESVVEFLVVGLPLSDKGELTEQCRDVINFCRRLDKRSKHKILLVDEYASSAEAEERILSYGRKKQGKKGMIDAVAASIILQAYLDDNTSGRPFECFKTEDSD